MNVCLAEKRETQSNYSRFICPFYQEENGDFYKNKLIEIEEVVYQVETNTEDNNEFEAFKADFYYLLTFKDEQGNIHQYKSKVKPKNTGKVFYYIVKDEEIINIFSEKNKKELKRYISVKNDYHYDSKIFRFNKYLMDNFFITFSIISVFISSLIYSTGFFDYLTNDGVYFCPLMIGTIFSLFLFSIGAEIAVIYFKKKENFKVEKEEEEKETTFKTFI